MSDKGGLVMVILFFVVLFSMQSKPVADPTQCDLPRPSSTLIDDVASMQKHFGNVNEKVENPPVPSPSDKPRPKPEIIIFTSASCPPCERWKRCEAPRFEQAGWKVAYCTDHNYLRTPTFLITCDGVSKEHVGFITLEQVAEVLK